MENKPVTIISIRGFDSKANFILTESFKYAASIGCNEVNSGHLMCVLFNNAKIGENFEEDTGIDKEAFKDAFELTMDAVDKVLDKKEMHALNIDNITKELHNILSKLAIGAEMSGRNATIKTIYKEIITTKECIVWGILEELGVDMEACIGNMLDPLDCMPVTAQFSVDYNKLAKNNRFDPIEARDDVIDSTFEVLGRRIKNNPCLVGEAGVGKTAIVEGMAQRLVKGDVPKYLKGKHIISVDISGVVSGSKFRGEFEERLNSILNEAASNRDVILFFDEFHMLAEAGSSNADSAMTASNILKPAISRGDVQIIGATTTTEYKKFIERDKAFERRLQMVAVKEPSIKAATNMVYAVIGEYNKYHNSEISNEAIELAVILSDRYITDKRLPDKAITIIDETAARLKKSVENDEVIKIGAAEIRQTISKITGIDIEDMDEESRGKVRALESSLKKRVIGQSEAIECVSKSIRRSKAGIKDPNRPIGSFLFVGPTGVGKTELCKALAIEFSGGVNSLVRFDMSEFMEKHSVSKLIGSPPGYVGYGEGGQLTEAIRRNPYSIILLDEIEKAHPDVFNILLQVLDDGILTDSEGTKVDFKNTIIVMTSNAGYGAHKESKSIGFGTVSEKQTSEKREQIALKELENTFRPEFLNRLDKAVVFNSLTKEDSKAIVGLLLNQLKQRLRDTGIKLEWDGSLVEYLVKEGFSEKYGARNLKRKLQSSIEDMLADKIIDTEVYNGDSVKLSYSDDVDIVIQKSILIKNKENKESKESIINLA